MPDSTADHDSTIRFVGVLAAFGAAYLAGRYSRRGPARIDSAIREAVVPRSNDGMKAVATVITPPAYPLIYMPAAVLIAIALSRRGNRAAMSVPRAAGLAFLSYHAVKRLSSRYRPPSQIHERNYSHAFPSGHTAAATAVTVATLNALRKNPNSAPSSFLLSLAAGIPVIVGASRLVLDQHWFTDVVGGWAVGTAVASAAD